MIEDLFDTLLLPKKEGDEQTKKTIEESNKLIYLLQLHINLRGKDYLLKYVGQTINFKARQKAHLRDLKSKWPVDMEEDKKPSYTRWVISPKTAMAFDYLMKDMGGWKVIKGKDRINLRFDVAMAINKAIEDEEYSFSVLHKALSKAELNCAESAYMFMLDPQMNSLWSEANCHDIECKICGSYGFWGHPNGIGVFRKKWHWPVKPMITNVGYNNRRKYLRTEIKQNRAQITFEKKWKAGWLPNDVPRLWK